MAGHAALGRAECEALTEEVEGWVTELWQRVKPDAKAKVAHIGSAVGALRDGCLTDSQRSAAWREAHQLAGSLGSYGFTDASDAAVDLERMLAGDKEIPLEAAARLFLRLHVVVQDNPDV